MEITLKEKDWFFYMMMDDGAYFRLSLQEIFEGRKTTDINVDGRVKLPDERMIHIMPGPTAFLLGNQHVYCLDSVARDCPSIFPPDPDTSIHRISRLIHQECSTENPPILETLEGKIYVLATPPPPKKSAERMLGLVASTDEHIHSETQRRSPRFFRVFDPSNNSWKHLSYPPHLEGSYRSFQASSKKPPYVKSYCAWGHKLIVHGAGSASGTSYMYNTRLEKWLEFWIYNAMAFVEVQGFFIAVQSYPKQVVASRLDSNGIPGREFKVLHQLDYIFCPFLQLGKCFMGRCGGDLLWIVYSSDNDNDYKCYTHVAIFQVSISLDHAGDPVLSAHLKASEEYHLAVDHSHDITQSDRLYSAFAMLQYLNKDDIREKELSVTPRCHHHSFQGSSSEDSEPHFVKRRRMSSSEDHSEPHGRLGSSSRDSESSLSSGLPPKLEIFPYQIHLVEEWVVPLRSVEDINEKFRQFCLQKLRTSPWHGSYELQVETQFTRKLLGSINTKGFLTINRKPAVNGERCCSPSVGWGYVYQKARLDFFCSKEKLDALVEKCKSLPSLKYIAMNREGSWISNIHQTDVNAVEWICYVSEKKTVEQTVVDSASFIVFKDEAFEIWSRRWANFYLEPEGDSSRKLLEEVQNNYFLVSLVDEDYIHGGDLFAVF